MKISTLVDVMVAACLTPYVDCRFPQCGGVLLVAPPGHLKTTVLMKTERVEGVRVLSDIHTRELNKLRDRIAAKEVRSLVFLDFQKIFERRSETSANLVGNIRALVDEGYSSLQEEGGGGNELPARATCIAALTPQCERYHRHDWEANGFARRMLKCMYRLDNPKVVVDAICRHNPLHIASNTVMPPIDGLIPYSVTEAESRKMAGMLRYQAGDETPLILLEKILSVLRWNHKRQRERDTSVDTINDFGESLWKTGADLKIDI